MEKQQGGRKTGSRYLIKTHRPTVVLKDGSHYVLDTPCAICGQTEKMVYEYRFEYNSISFTVPMCKGCHAEYDHCNTIIMRHYDRAVLSHDKEILDKLDQIAKGVKRD